MRYTTHLKGDERRASATRLIKLLLANNCPALSDHVEDMIDTLLWRITEADGKQNLIYKSSGAIAALAGRNKSKTIHEHVYQRRKMIDALIQAKPEAVDHILKDAIGCLVTVDEHERLRPFDREYGWDRYRRADIAVMDTSVDPPKTVNF
jgi:hypothetical protein